MNDKQIMTNEQLELGLSGAKLAANPAKKQTRMTRAAWWFGQMRQIVDRAIDWQPAPAARPEQEWLGLSHRRPSARTKPPGNPRRFRGAPRQATPRSHFRERGVAISNRRAYGNGLRSRKNELLRIRWFVT